MVGLRHGLGPAFLAPAQFGVVSKAIVAGISPVKGRTRCSGIWMVGQPVDDTLWMGYATLAVDSVRLSPVLLWHHRLSVKTSLLRASPGLFPLPLPASRSCFKVCSSL
jgi:hypothetical protein